MAQTVNFTGAVDRDLLKRGPLITLAAAEIERRAVIAGRHFSQIRFPPE